MTRISDIAEHAGAEHGGTGVSFDMTATEPERKTCSCCRHDRPVGRFLYSQFSVDGLTERCLDCISAEAAAQRQQRELRRNADVREMRKPRRKSANHSYPTGTTVGRDRLAISAIADVGNPICGNEP